MTRDPVRLGDVPRRLDLDRVALAVAESSPPLSSTTPFGRGLVIGGEPDRGSRRLQGSLRFES